MKAHNIIKCVLALSMAVASVTSCQEKIGGFAKGEAVRFSVGTDAVSTKAVYSGQGTSTIERIDWQEGDLIRIYCEQVSEPSDKFADYRVTSDITASESNSTAHIEGLGGVGLRWGDGNHTFYAVYPSPEEGGSVTTGISIGSYENGGTKSTVSESIAGAIVTANLPAKQAVIGGVTETPSGSGNYIAAPDLKNMLMTAKSAEYSPETGITDDVFLSFTPLTTAIKFTITNQTEAPLTIKSVSLTSAASALSGPFEVNMDNNSVPASIDLDGDGSNTGDKDIKYSRSYPECTYTGSVSDATKTVTINFASPVELAYDEVLANCGKLTFTFFLQPCKDYFDDLTFKITKSDDSWMSTKLGYTDGTGVLFPRFKKTTVTGLLVPKGAQWRVKFEPDIVKWNAEQGEHDELNLEYPEGEVAPIMTEWATGEWKDLLLEDNND